MLYGHGKRTRDFLEAFLFFSSLVCSVSGAFLIKQLFHSPLLDMSQLGAMRLVGYLPSHIQRALVE